MTTYEYMIKNEYEIEKGVLGKIPVFRVFHPNTGDLIGIYKLFISIIRDYKEGII